jgi:hypothetical protein
MLESPHQMKTHNEIEVTKSYQDRADQIPSGQNKLWRNVPSSSRETLGQNFFS